MRRSNRSIRSLRVSFRKWGDSGVLEPGQMEDALRALRALEKALGHGDIPDAKAAMNRLAKVFVNLSQASR